MGNNFVKGKNRRGFNTPGTLVGLLGLRERSTSLRKERQLPMTHCHKANTQQTKTYRAGRLGLRKSCICWPTEERSPVLGE